MKYSPCVIALCLVPNLATAGPIPAGAFLDTPPPSWAAPYLPAHLLTLTPGAFAFADGDGVWELLADVAPCGENHAGWNGGPLPGIVTTADPITFTYQIGAGSIWSSAADPSYFALFADTDGYIVGMTADCDQAVPPDDTPPGDGIDGNGEPNERPYTPQPPQFIRLTNGMLLRFRPSTPPPPPLPTPEPLSLVLFGSGLLLLAKARRR